MPNKILRILIGLEECFRKWKLDDKVFLFLLTTVSCGHDTANCKLPSWVQSMVSRVCVQAVPVPQSTARVPCLTGCWQQECNKLTTPNTPIGTERNTGELQHYSCWFKKLDQMSIQKKSWILGPMMSEENFFFSFVGCVICFHLKALR